MIDDDFIDKMKEKLNDPDKLIEYRLKETKEITQNILNCLSERDGYASLISLIKITKLYKRKIGLSSPLAVKEISEFFGSKECIDSFEKLIDENSVSVIIGAEGVIKND